MLVQSSLALSSRHIAFGLLIVEPPLLHAVVVSDISHKLSMHISKNR